MNIIAMIMLIMDIVHGRRRAAMCHAYFDTGRQKRVMEASGFLLWVITLDSKQEGRRKVPALHTYGLASKVEDGFDING